MPRPHGIFVEGVVVLFIPQYTDAALCQKGIAFAGNILGDNGNFLICRQVQGTVQSRNAAADDDNIGFRMFHFAFSSILSRGGSAFARSASSTNTSFSSVSSTRRTFSMVFSFISGQQGRVFGK